MTKAKFCRLSLELLEAREVPTTNVVQVTELPERRFDVLPGDSRVVANLKVATSSKQFFAQPTEMLFIGAFGGGLLSQNTSGLKLMADLDGNRKNGCEALLAERSADPETDVVNFNISAPVSVNRSHPLRIQVVANFSWLLKSDRMGVKLVKANFDDLFDQPIPEAEVIYREHKPTLHKLRTATLYAVQEEMAPSATVRAGDKVSLLKFFMNDQEVSSGKMRFPLERGNLGNAIDYMLVHTNWNGVRDQFIPGTVVGGKVEFNLTKDYAKGNWEVEAIMANVGAGSQLQLRMPTDGSSLVAWDVHGRKLKGFRFNEASGGQIQVSAQSNWATLYTVA